MQSARSAIGEVDLVVLLLEGCERPGRGDAFIELLRTAAAVMVVLNKWDKVSPDQEESAEASCRELLAETGGRCTCSALAGDGCLDLVAQMAATLPPGPQLYPPEMVCDQPERILLGELIREQVLLHTREEVPHSVAVTIDRVEEMPPTGKEWDAPVFWPRAGGAQEPEGHPDRQRWRHAQDDRPGGTPADADPDRWPRLSGAVREGGAGLAQSQRGWRSWVTRAIAEQHLTSAPCSPC